MFYLLLLTALWKVASCEGPTFTPSVEITLPPSTTGDFMRRCTPSSVTVQMRTLKIGDIRYTRKVVSEEYYLCMATGAVLLDADELLACVKEAIAKEYNTFYMDDQSQCFGTNQQVFDSCSAEGIVVYTTDIPIAPNSVIVPDFESVSIDNVVVNDSFRINFYPSCDAFEYLLLDEDLLVLGAVKNSDTVTSDITPIPPCTKLTFALQATIAGNAASIARLISVETPPILDVAGFNVDTFVVDESFVVHFTATCPLHYKFQLQLNGEVFDGVTPGQTVRYPVPPCTELTPTLHVLEDDAEVLVLDASESPTYTPAVPDVTDFYVDPFLSANSFEVHFSATCPDQYTFNLEYDGETFENVSSGDTLQKSVSPCTGTTATLTLIDDDGIEVGSGVSGTAKTIPFSFAELEGTCFYFSENVARFSVAKTSCPAGSILATPTSLTTRQAIVVHLQAKLPDSDGWYIDITRDASGVWKYGDGTDETSEAGLTNAKDQSCARFRTETSYRLEDIYCFDKLTFICQYTG